jgi:electron transfer flavoprotein alpha subunit
MGRSKAPKSERQIESEEHQDQESRKETAEKKYRLSASRRRRFGKSILMSMGGRGISDKDETLG